MFLQVRSALEGQFEGPSGVQVALGGQFEAPSGVQVALGGHFEGPSGVQVALAGQFEEQMAFKRPGRAARTAAQSPTWPSWSKTSFAASDQPEAPGKDL